MQPLYLFKVCFTIPVLWRGGGIHRRQSMALDLVLECYAIVGTLM